MNYAELGELVEELDLEDHKIEVYCPIKKDFIDVTALAWDGDRVRLLSEGLEDEFAKHGITEATSGDLH